MRALVHSGGGSNGDWGVGVLKYLMLDAKRNYDAFVGISTGALTCAFVAQHKAGEEEQAVQGMEDIYLKKIKNNSSIYKKWFLWPLSLAWKPSVYYTDPLKNLVYSGLDRTKLLQSGKKLAVGAVRLNGDQRYEVFTEQDYHIVDAVLASSAYPVGFPPIKIKDYWYSDGGLRNIVPLKTAIDLGADELDVIITSPVNDGPSNYDANHANVITTLSAATNIMSSETLLNDIVLKDINVALAKNRDPRYKRLVINMIRPSRDLGNSLNFGKDKTPSHAENMALGYLDAKVKFKG